jgi:hypothetical protein
VLGGDRDRVAKPKRKRLCRTRLALSAFALVGDQHHRLAGLAHEVREGAILRRQARARIDDEHQRIGRLNRHRGLFAHARGERSLGAVIEPRGVNHGEAEIAQACVAFAPVARDARLVIDQRQLLANKAIEQRRLADVRASDQCNREGHISTPETARDPAGEDENGSGDLRA